MIRSGRTITSGTPIPSTREPTCRTGSLITYRLSPEELEDVRKRTERRHQLDVAKRIVGETWEQKRAQRRSHR